MEIVAKISVDFDEERQTWWIGGIHFDATDEVPAIAGLSNIVFEYRDGKLVAGLRQFGHPCFEED